jgi:hypothetical protein
MCVSVIFPQRNPLLSLVMFATFLLVLFYRYDTVTASLWIRYPGILLGEVYNWHLYGCKLFCGQETPTSFLAPLLGKPVSTISLCRIIFCSILFVVLTEMC